MEPRPEWGMLIVVYFFLGGIAAGSYFLAVLTDFFGSEADRPVSRLGYSVAMPLAMILPLLLIADLGTPMRAFNMFLAFKPESPMSVGSWGLLGFTLFTFASWSLSRSPADEHKARDSRRKLGLIGGIFGFFIASYTGVLLSTTTLPVWGDTYFIGVLFLLSGASSAIAVLTIGLQANGSLNRPLWKRLSKLDEIILAMEILILVVFLATIGDSAAVFLTGRYAFLFWVFAIAGILIPTGMKAAAIYAPTVVPSTDRVKATTAGLSILGGFIMRYLIVYAAQL